MSDKMTVHYSSASVEWSSPQDFFDEIAKRFNFVLDACATDENTKCGSWFTKEVDGRRMNWQSNGDVWMNPPYGRGIGSWVQKAADTAKNGTTVVCLLPARTDTKWFHDFCLKYGDVEFIKGRLKFGGHKGLAPFPSMIVIFTKETPHDE
jgi:phage N-6-adenine-methyltransferase